MDASTKIFFMFVYKKNITLLFHKLTEIFKLTFEKAEIVGDNVTQNIDKLQEKIISLSNSNKVNIILILGPKLLKGTIADKINMISEEKNEMIKKFSRIPLLLKPDISEFLHCSYKKSTLIFSVTAGKLNILNIIQENAESMVLAAYLLRQVFVYSNISIENFEKKEEKETKNEAENRMCKRNRKSSTEEEEEDEDKSTSSLLSTTLTMSTSPNLTRSKTIDDNDEDIDIVDTFDKSEVEPQVQESHKPKICAETALKIINEIVIKNQDIETIETEEVDIKDAFDRILSKAATCRSSVPPFPVVTKRGYAVVIDKETNERKEKTDESSEINLEIMDFGMRIEVDKGECLPDGTDTVIPTENISYSDGDKIQLKTTSPAIKCGQNIKLSGSDIKKDEVIVNARKRIGSTEIALLTACGYDKVTVNKKSSIALMTIEYKLQKSEHFSLSEHIRDSSRAIIISLLKENGFHFYDHGIATINSIFIKVASAVKIVDLVVITGYIDEKDNLAHLFVNHFKATLHFESVYMKPGKSTAFASFKFDGKIKYILFLSRNPASVLITAHLFLLPLVNYMHYIYVQPTIITTEVNEKLLLHSRPQYMWATISWIDETCYAKVTCKANLSNNIFDVGNADVLLQLPEKSSEQAKMLSVPSSVPAILIKFPYNYTMEILPGKHYMIID